MIFWKKRLRQRWFGAALAALFTLLLGLLLYFTVIGEKVVSLSYDIPFAFRDVDVPTNAVLVYLDEHCQDALGEPLDRPLDRARHGELIKRLMEAGASVIVFDFLFSEEGKTPTPSDLKFAEAIKPNAKVVLGGAWKTNRGLVTIEKPLLVLRNAGADWGLVQYRKQEFGPREHLETKDGLPSMAWTAAKMVDAPVTKTSSQDAVKRWINYYGRPDTLPRFTYSDVYSNSFPANAFQGKAVFVGSRMLAGFSGAAKDEFPTAFTWISGMHSPGTEIHATVFLNLLRQDWLTRFPRWAEIFLVVFFGIGAGFGLSILYSRAATAVALLASFGVIAAAWLFFRYEFVWFAWLIPVLQLFFGLFWSVVFNSIQAYAERKVLEHSLSLHLPERRVKQILKSPELLAPTAEKQEVSLMFTDIADWSTISDRVAPDRLFKHLNRYFEKTIPCVHKEDGMVLQLIGDAIFAIWNAPEPQPNHQERACVAALKLRDELVEFESGNENYPLRTRVGLHCGPASVGNCGSAERLVYTALGAETNMAARLEGLNKYLGTQILASDRIVTEAVEEKFTWRCMGRFKLKGSDRVLEIYELLDARDKEENSRAWRKVFSAGLRHFQHQEWDEAIAAFSQVILERKDDGPSRFYLRKIESLRHEKLPEKWFGEVSMDEK
jgi:adenylate cyclase